MIVDLVVHYIVSNEEEPDKMTVKYATTYSYIKNASEEQYENSCQILQKIITDSLKPFNFEGGQQEREYVQAQQLEEGKKQLWAVFQPKIVPKECNIIDLTTKAEVEDYEARLQLLVTQGKMYPQRKGEVMDALREVA